MTSGPPLDAVKAMYAPIEARRTAPWPNQFEEPFVRQYAPPLNPARAAPEQSMKINRQRLQSTGGRDLWVVPQPPATLRLPLSAAAAAERTPASYAPNATPPEQRWLREDWANRQTSDLQEAPSVSHWNGSPPSGQYSMQATMSPPDPQSRSGHTGWHGSWPAPLLRRTSSDDARLSRFASGYYGGDASSNPPSLHGKTYPQRHPSNRDEFDGPSQFLDKSEDSTYEPTEEELPPLPTTLYAQEQDEILSKVNDRLSRCAFDFVAKYQFPIPIEPDKRPVRLPGDREWSEWVYLLKRLATKRRIPARVLYNGQIKQLITILENSLEMRHATKHQSRPLKDDRNILQLISSGLQVAKIVKDAPAMQFLDQLYVHTERMMQSRRARTAATTYSST